MFVRSNEKKINYFYVYVYLLIITKIKNKKKNQIYRTRD